MARPVKVVRPNYYAHSMTEPQINMQVINRSNEANDARSLFSYGLHVTSEMRRDYHGAVAAMSLLALGSEKLVKLTIGLTRLHNGQAWPSQNYMQRIGHKVATGDRKARRLLAPQLSQAPEWIRDLDAKVVADPVLDAVLGLLERFGKDGRFYFLDALGNDPQTERAPHFLWLDMCNIVAQADPAISSMSASPDETVRLQGRAQLNSMIVASLAGWWEFYRSVWRSGVIGDHARELTPELRLLNGSDLYHGQR